MDKIKAIMKLLLEQVSNCPGDGGDGAGRARGRECRGQVQGLS